MFYFISFVTSKLYWSDRGKIPRISSANLDGSDVRVLASGETGEMSWPLDVVVDPHEGRVYWIDSKLHTLETVSVTGKDRRVLHKFSHQGNQASITYINNIWKIY